MSLTHEEVVFWMQKIYKDEFDSMFQDYDQKSSTLEELEKLGLIKTSPHSPVGLGSKMKILGPTTEKGWTFIKNHKIDE